MTKLFQRQQLLIKSGASVSEGFSQKRFTESSSIPGGQVVMSQ